MTDLDIKGLGGLIKSVGPTEEQRQQFGRTFLGTLLGQSVVFVGLMLAYMAAVVLLWKYAFDKLHDLYTTIGPLAFWSINTAPLVCILAFSMLPTGWRALRERRLKAAVISGDAQFKPGYFRLYPYGETDRDTFKRLDGEDVAIVGWLRAARSPLLYLSGASGVGKSSLVAASVLPKLRDEGCAIVTTRLFGNPIEHLRGALINAELIPKKSASSLSSRELLERAGAEHAKKGAASILLVIDQFEEFLILHREEDRAPFAALLTDLVKRPIKGLRLLLVFRSDYRALVFKLDLPPLTSGDNWHELAPYDRGTATTFLQSGGRELSTQSLDILFRGLDRIEDAPGIYRPITLNMVGLVLERMGRTLQGDPSRLIQTYLTNCLTQGETRDFAKPLLAQMITDAGTKEPRAETELVDLTAFEPWQINATLADLARQGLVRRLEGATAVWEVAHDFLARVIGQLIGRSRPSLLQRVRPLVAPTVLLGWALLSVVAVPYWFTLQERASEATLRAEGASLSNTANGGMSVSFPGYLNDKGLIVASPHLVRLKISALRFTGNAITSLEPIKSLTSLTSLDVYFATGITSLEPLKSLTRLTSLSLVVDTGITSLEPIKDLTNLTNLDLSGVFGIASLEPIKGLTNLTNLNLTGVSGIASLEPVKGLTSLTWLDLSRATGITNLEPIKGLTNLTRLDLSRATGITSLEAIKDLINLTNLNLSDATGIASLKPIEGLTNLTNLNLTRATGIASLEPIKGLTNLTSLDLSQATGITSLEPIKGLTRLTWLNLSQATGIASLEPTKGLTNLTSLNLTGASGITSLEPIKGLTNLTSLNLTGASGITSLEPISRKIHIIGASEQLLATMK